MGENASHGEGGDRGGISTEKTSSSFLIRRRHSECLLPSGDSNTEAYIDYIQIKLFLPPFPQANNLRPTNNTKKAVGWA